MTDLSIPPVACTLLLAYRLRHCRSDSSGVCRLHCYIQRFSLNGVDQSRPCPMDTSQDGQPTAFSEIPNEVLLRIFEWAAFVPGALETDVCDPFETLQPLRFDMGHQIKSLQIALDTKLSLVRVCKRWRTLAMPILYEAVVIHGHDGLFSLCQDLNNPNLQQAPDLGWWVRRMDLILHDLVGETEEFEDDILSMIAHVFSRLPNLRILVISINASTIEDMDVDATFNNNDRKRLSSSQYA